MSAAGASSGAMSRASMTGQAPAPTPTDESRDAVSVDRLAADVASLDAEALYTQLRSRIAALIEPDTVLVGVWSGGAWLAERLHRDLGRRGEHGVISSALHRDDFASRGLAGADPTRLPFEVDGSRILLVDDVLYTGRTVRAVINELYDFGRPARIALAVLVDRGGRQLPIEAALSIARVGLAAEQRLSLVRDAAGRFAFEVR